MTWQSGSTVSRKRLVVQDWRLPRLDHSIRFRGAPPSRPLDSSCVTCVVQGAFLMFMFSKSRPSFLTDNYYTSKHHANLS
ncbi:MAG: hypothetical protein IKP58_16080 [Victivallales bacterium]|nr:hypothetical protein [Victivallales bacterium]